LILLIPSDPIDHTDPSDPTAIPLILLIPLIPLIPSDPIDPTVPSDPSDSSDPPTSEFSIELVVQSVHMFQHTIAQNGSTQVLQRSVAPMLSFPIQLPVGSEPESTGQRVQAFLTSVRSHAV